MISKEKNNELKMLEAEIKALGEQDGGEWLARYYNGNIYLAYMHDESQPHKIDPKKDAFESKGGNKILEKCGYRPALYPTCDSFSGDNGIPKIMECALCVNRFIS